MTFMKKISMFLCKYKYIETVPLTIFDTVQIVKKSWKRIGCALTQVISFKQIYRLMKKKENLLSKDPLK